MKAIIPVAGIGTHLRPLTHTQPKPLIPVAGKPILGYIIEKLIEAGIRNQVFVVGYLKEKIQAFVLDRYQDEIQAEFIEQSPRKGLAHALWVSRNTILHQEEIVIVLGDTIFDKDIPPFISCPGSLLAVQEVENPRDFGIAILNDKGMVEKVMEKPQIPTSNLALVGLYKIQSVSVLLDVLEQLMSQDRPEQVEYTLTEALMMMIQRGVDFRAYRVENWYDCGHKETLLSTNRILLEQDHPPQPYSFEHTVVIPPVFIAEGCRISNSIIGPYVAVGEHSVIHHSIIQNSIIGAYSELDTIVLNNSILGNDSALKGKSNSVNIGDNTEISFEQ